MASIRKRNDKWQARVVVAGQEVCKTFLYKTDAARWAREQQTEMEKAVAHGCSGYATLAMVINRYLVEVLPTRRGRGQDTYLVRRFLQMPWSELAVAKVRPEHIATMRDLRLKEVSTGSVRRELDVLSSIFNHAIKEWRLCRENPVLSIKKPSPGRARQRRLMPDELERVIQASQSPDFTAIITLALETVMRRSEILGLQWSNIDLGRRLAFLPLTKNGESRYVPLSSKALEILQKLPRRSDGKVFDKNGTSLSGAFQRAVTRARKLYEAECAQAGVTADQKYLTDLRLHDLRHAATTRFVEHGLNLIEVSAITGHKTLSMLKRYSHPDPELRAKKIG